MRTSTLPKLRAHQARGIFVALWILLVIFGREAGQALAMLDAGEGRDAIFQKTGALVAVHDADLAIEPGEICVLMGLSGSGKSSLLRCVNGLNRASRGRILVADGTTSIDISRCDAATLRLCLPP